MTTKKQKRDEGVAQAVKKQKIEVKTQKKKTKKKESSSSDDSEEETKVCYNLFSIGNLHGIPFQ